jgi:hypothetical protein
MQVLLKNISVSIIKFIRIQHMGRFQDAIIHIEP